MTSTGAINDGNYIPITSCEGSNNYTHALIGRGRLIARDIHSSCTLGATVVTGKFKEVPELRNSTTMSDLQGILLMGLELSFLFFRCGECKGSLSSCNLNFDDSRIRCYNRTDGRNCERP